jgi:uncharacterized protein YcfJ
MADAVADKKIRMLSIGRGIGGYFKGFLVGGAVGAIAGGLVGAVVGAALSGFNPIAMAIGAVKGAVVGGSLFGNIGGISGAMTEVVRTNMHTDRIPEEDAVAMAKVAYAQGLAKSKQPMLEKDAGTQWQDRHAAQLAEQAKAQQQGAVPAK